MQVTCDRCGETYEIQFRTQGLLLCDECAGATLEQQYQDILEANKDDQAVEVDWREVCNSMSKDIDKLSERIADLEGVVYPREIKATIDGEDNISTALLLADLPISAKNPYKFLLRTRVPVRWISKEGYAGLVPSINLSDMEDAINEYDKDIDRSGARNA